MGIQRVVVGDVIKRLVHDEVRGCDQALPIHTLDPSRVREHCLRCAGDDRSGPKLHSALNRWCWSFRLGVQEGDDDSSAQHGSGSSSFADTPQHICRKTRRAQSTKSSRVTVGSRRPADACPVRMGQHQALQAVQESLQPTETLMAFLDDVCVLSNPDRTSDVEGSVERELWDHARIQVNQGKTQVWNRSGVRPTDCDHLFFRPDGQPIEVWRGDRALPLHIQLSWKPSFPRKLQSTRLFSIGSLRCKICSVTGSCSCFALHREQSAPFALFTLKKSLHFAARHDAGIRGCLEQLLHNPVTDEVWQMATPQFSSGGLGLRNAERLRPTAYWASWVQRRHPGIADHLMLSLLRSTQRVPSGGSE